MESDFRFLAEFDECPVGTAIDQEKTVSLELDGSVQARDLVPGGNETTDILPSQ